MKAMTIATEKVKMKMNDCDIGIEKSVRMRSSMLCNSTALCMMISKEVIHLNYLMGSG